jgi:hypothetical protein
MCRSISEAEYRKSSRIFAKIFIGELKELQRVRLYFTTETQRTQRQHKDLEDF